MFYTRNQHSNKREERYCTPLPLQPCSQGPLRERVGEDPGTRLSRQVHELKAGYIKLTRPIPVLKCVLWLVHCRESWHLVGLALNRCTVLLPPFAVILCGEFYQIHEGGLWLADEAYTCPWLRSLIGLLLWILTPHWLGLKPAHCTSFTRENWFRQGWTTTSRMILASSFLFAIAFACLLPRLPGTEVSLQTPHKQENKSNPGQQPCSFLATWRNKEIENCGHLKSGI